MRILVPAILAAMAVSPLWADAVRLADGTVLRGKVKAKTADKLVFEYEKGRFRTIPRSEIERIEKDGFEFPSPATATEKAGHERPVSPATGGARPDKKDAEKSVEEKDRAERFDATLRILGKANLQRVEKLAGWDRNVAAQMIIPPINCFIREPDGKVNKDADEEAFNAAIDHVNPAMIETAMGLIVHERDPIAFGQLGPRNAAFLGLLGASGAFVHSKSKFNADAFDAALGNLTAAQIERAKELVKDDPEASPLVLLLRAAGRYYLSSEGRLDKNAFDAALDGMTTDKMAAKMKEMKGPDVSTAFDRLMRPPAP